MLEGGSGNGSEQQQRPLSVVVGVRHAIQSQNSLDAMLSLILLLISIGMLPRTILSHCMANKSP